MAFLSILFMRFEQALSRLHGTSTMGLSILFMRFCPRPIVHHAQQ